MQLAFFLDIFLRHFNTIVLVDVVLADHDYGSPCRDVHVDEVWPVVPFFVNCFEPDLVALFQQVVAAKLLLVTVEQNHVVAWPIGSDPVIFQALGGMEIENEEEIAFLEND